MAANAAVIPHRSSDAWRPDPPTLLLVYACGPEGMLVAAAKRRPATDAQARCQWNESWGVAWAAVTAALSLCERGKAVSITCVLSLRDRCFTEIRSCGD